MKEATEQVVPVRERVEEQILFYDCKCEKCSHDWKRACGAPGEPVLPEKCPRCTSPKTTVNPHYEPREVIEMEGKRI